jgi:hypothetical protein
MCKLCGVLISRLLCQDWYKNVRPAITAVDSDKLINFYGHTSTDAGLPYSPDNLSSSNIEKHKESKSEA